MFCSTQVLIPRPCEASGLSQSVSVTVLVASGERERLSNAESQQVRQTRRPSTTHVFVWNIGPEETHHHYILVYEERGIQGVSIISGDRCCHLYSSCIIAVQR
jgi:hypothetical protein